MKRVGFEKCKKWCESRNDCKSFDLKDKTGDCYPSDKTEPLKTGGGCKKYTFYKKNCNKPPPSDAKKAIIEMGASFKVQSSWDNHRWRNPRLDGNGAAHVSKADYKARKNYWIEIDFQKESTVYAVVMKRRADTDRSGALKKRVNTKIWVQYLHPDSNKWVYYKDKENVLTGQTYGTKADEELVINLEPFRTKSAAIWLINEGDNVAPSTRCDFMISPEARDEAPEPPANAVKAMMDLNFPYKLHSSWNKKWSNPRLDSSTAAHLGRKESANGEDYWIEVDFDKPLDVYGVILKRRADTNKAAAYKLQTNSHIYVQYKDPSSGKWVWYQGDKNNLIPTGA